MKIGYSPRIDERENNTEFWVLKGGLGRYRSRILEISEISRHVEITYAG